MGTEHQTMVKGCEVEVCSQEEGFKGAYFKALLQENSTKSERKKVSVRYMTLLNDDGSSPLTESVHQRLLRPVPPEEEYSGVVLEEGTVVDAYLRDGWWTGVVINKKLEDENYLVYFDSPPDVIKFDKTKLRAHVDWIDSKWVRPELKELDKSSMYSPGTMVEVSSLVDKSEVAWCPAMLIKDTEEDGEKKFIVKDCNQHLSRFGEEARPNTTVDSRRVRPAPPPYSVEEFKLLDCVEAFHGSVWRQGLVRGVLSGNRYMVCLEATKEEHVFRHSHVRPLKVWEDGAWHDGPKGETPSMKLKTVTPKKGRKHARRSLNPETVASTGELRNNKSDAVMMTGETPPVITPQVTSIVVTPSPHVVSATSLKQTKTETEGQQTSEKTPKPRSTHNGLGNDSIPQKIHEEETSQGKFKRKRKEEQYSDLNETDETCNSPKADSDVDDQPLSCCIGNISIEVSSSSNQSPNVMVNSTVEETPLAPIALPFAKMSPYWKSYEAKEGYKTVPQRPHFSPLVEAKDDDLREWSAVGMMVTFYGLLEEVKGLKPDDSLSLLRSLSDSFVELEKYGFDIAAAQSRISKLMSLKDEQAKKDEEIQCLEKKVDEDETISRKLAEEIAELKRREAVAKEEKLAADKRIVEMRSSGKRIEQEIEDVDIEFLKTASAPW